MKFAQSKYPAALKDIAYHTSPRSGASEDYAKGALVGLVAALQFKGYKFNTAWQMVRAALPDDFRADCIPATWPMTVKTVWQTITYDVWGNARDGYEVNQAFTGHEVELEIPVTVNNPGTPREFRSASPTDAQIRKALDLRKFQMDTDGDDLNIYVTRQRDSYPAGELRCISHASLSPIRAKGSDKPQPVTSEPAEPSEAASEPVKEFDSDFDGYPKSV